MGEITRKTDLLSKVSHQIHVRIRREAHLLQRLKRTWYSEQRQWSRLQQWDFFMDYFADTKTGFFPSGHILRQAEQLTSLLGKVLNSLNSSHGNPLEATKSKRIWSLLLARKRRSRNLPLGVRMRSLLTGSAFSSSGSGGRACSKESRMA